MIRAQTRSPTLLPLLPRLTLVHCSLCAGRCGRAGRGGLYQGTDRALQPVPVARCPDHGVPDLQMDGEALFTTQAVFDQRDRGGWTDVLWGGWLVDGLFWSVSITLTSLAVNSLLRRRHRPVDHGSILNGPPL